MEPMEDTTVHRVVVLIPPSLAISGLWTPHLYENNNKDGDEEVEMMVVMLLLIDK